MLVPGWKTLVRTSRSRLIIRTRSAIRSARCAVSKASSRVRSVTVSTTGKSRRSRTVWAITYASFASVLPSPVKAVLIVFTTRPDA
jgi:hypothetical protein